MRFRWIKINWFCREILHLLKSMREKIFHWITYANRRPIFSSCPMRAGHWAEEFCTWILHMPNYKHSPYHDQVENSTVVKQTKYLINKFFAATERLLTFKDAARIKTQLAKQVAFCMNWGLRLGARRLVFVIF